ncbi:MAG: hypothetical protein Q7S92_00450 [Candidatus Diapherotrites archaeon]|nr:hypothetical protein [Candidatus Diapherotrites archaeon]
MDLTKECLVSGKQGFEREDEMKFAIIEVQGKAYDKIRLNRIPGLRFRELLSVSEHPIHEEHPILVLSTCEILLGGEEKASKRTLCVIGK